MPEDPPRWDLTPLFADREEWRATVDEVNAALADVTDADGVVTSCDAVEEVLESIQFVVTRTEQLLAYARLRFDLDRSAEQRRRDLRTAREVYGDVATAVEFLPAVLASRPAELRSYLARTNEMGRFGPYVESVHRVRDHLLDPDAELVASRLGEDLTPIENAYGTLVSDDFDEPVVEVPNEGAVEIGKYKNRIRLQFEGDRETRRRIYERYYAELRKSRHTIAQLLVDSARYNVAVADLRGYPTVRRVDLDRQAAPLVAPISSVPESCFDAVLSGIRSHLGPLHDGYRLKETYLDVQSLQHWDVKVPYSASYDERISLDEMRSHVVSSLEPLGSSYQSRVERLFEDGRVDATAREHKTKSEAYQFGAAGAGPFVLFNYREDYRDFVLPMFLLTHQLGHACARLFAEEAAPPLFARPNGQLDEVASRLHEFLLVDHLLEAATDADLRVRTLQVAEERLRQEFYMAGANLEFVDAVHSLVADGASPTADELDDEYLAVLETYLAPVEFGDHSASSWIATNYYDHPYQLFEGVLSVVVAADLVSHVRSDPSVFETFLSEGLRSTSEELLERLPTDVTDLGVVEAAATRYQGYVDSLSTVFGEP